MVVTPRKVAVAASTLLLTSLLVASPASAHTVRRHHRPPPRFAALSVPAPRVPWEQVKEHVAACESGGNYLARNRRSTASGKYQILNSTWANRFGIRQAFRATPDQQEQVAAELHAARGLQPWNASQRCWRRRMQKGTDVRVR